MNRERCGVVHAAESGREKRFSEVELPGEDGERNEIERRKK